ncbi:MAG: hypothetical protein HFJ28_05155 [Clostridia bacterium]|nr:hypothetical protein [Clostridia bacterium]
MKSQKGITLISLTVTIVVLLILAAIGGTLIANANDFFKSAQNVIEGSEQVVNSEQQKIDRLEDEVFIDIGEAPSSAVVKTLKSYYATLQDAINEENLEKTTIFLLKDITESVTIPANKTIVLYLDNHTLTGAETATITNRGELTITGGTIKSQNSNVINNYGIIQIGQAAVVTGEAINDATIYNQAKGKITITGGAIHSKQAVAIENVQEGKLTIAGGTINANINAIVNLGIMEVSENANISCAGVGYATISNEQTGDILITGGFIISEKNHAIKNKGILEINEKANIKNDIAEYATIRNEKTGNLRIVDGTITNTKNGDAISNNEGKVTILGGNLSKDFT